MGQTGLGEHPDIRPDPRAFCNAACWTPTVRELALRGHRALVVNLPGRGFGATIPTGYLGPQNPATMATEPSAMARIGTVDDVAAGDRCAAPGPRARAERARRRQPGRSHAHCGRQRHPAAGKPAGLRLSALPASDDELTKQAIIHSYDQPHISTGRTRRITLAVHPVEVKSVPESSSTAQIPRLNSYRAISATFIKAEVVGQVHATSKELVR